MHSVELIGVGSPIVDTLAHVTDAFIEGIRGDKGGMVLVEEAEMAQILAGIPQDQLHQSPGGSAGNTTFAAARLGLKTAFLGKIGNDAVADFFTQSLLQAGGDASRLKHGNVANGRCLSMITEDSQRTMRTNLGAAMTLAPEEITPEDFRGCKMAHIEGYLLFNPALIARVLECAKQAGCHISLDMASFEVIGAAKDSLPQILREYVDIVFANEDEAATLLGGNDYEAMARQLGQWCDIAVVKLGKAGSIVCHENTIIHAGAVQGISARDTTGAGDFYAAGFLREVIRGNSMKAAARLGAELGAAVVQVTGTELSDAEWARLNG